jgi:hypothetical protein
MIPGIVGVSGAYQGIGAPTRVRSILISISEHDGDCWPETASMRIVEAWEAFMRKMQS